MSEPHWLTSQEIIEINIAQVALTGEPYALLSVGMLDSALTNPINAYHYLGERDVAVLARRLLFAIARNHAFEQGNKRTGLVAAIEFLELNGYTLVAPDDETLGQLIVSVLEGDLREDSFQAIIEPMIEAIP